MEIIDHAELVFSSSFAISATSAVETGTTVSDGLLVPSFGTSVQAGVMRASTLGVLTVVKSLRPGSTRSGEKARKKSTPTLRLN